MTKVRVPLITEFCVQIFLLAFVKVDMEARRSEWQRELEDLSSFFKKLYKLRKKSLLDDPLVSYVANKQLELLKRVNVSFRSVTTKYMIDCRCSFFFIYLFLSYGCSSVSLVLPQFAFFFRRFHDLTNNYCILHLLCYCKMGFSWLHCTCTVLGWRK